MEHRGNTKFYTLCIMLLISQVRNPTSHISHLQSQILNLKFLNSSIVSSQIRNPQSEIRNSFPMHYEFSEKFHRQQETE